jgi:hypothetical protein
MRRFWSKVLRGGPNMCWPWQTSARGGASLGYGKFRIDRNTIINAHKMAYILSKGEVPPGLVVRHKCDNPACCNPDHLELGTMLDNTRDQFARGRHRSQRDPDEMPRITVPHIVFCQRCRKPLQSDHADAGACPPCAKALSDLATEAYL